MQGTSRTQSQGDSFNWNRIAAMILSGIAKSVSRTGIPSEIRTSTPVLFGFAHLFKATPRTLDPGFG